MLVCPVCRLNLSEDGEPCPRDGAAGVERAPIGAIPDPLSRRFEVAEPFALGGTGELYWAQERGAEQRGVLKVLPPSSSVVERARLTRELFKQSSLKARVLVVPLASGMVEQRPWLFRPHCSGQSLRSKLCGDTTLPLEWVLMVAAQTAVGLDELHRVGLLHRDLKPGHIIVDEETAHPQVALIDAAIAGRIEQTGVFEVLGTPEYLSPEQASGERVNFRSDLYSLGCVIFEMLSGSPPFTGAPAEVLAAHRDEAPPELDSEIPEPVRKLVDKLLKKNPRERPFSAQQVQRALQPLLPVDITRLLRDSTTGRQATGPVSAPDSVPPPAPLAAAVHTVIGAPQRAFRGDEPTEELSALDLKLPGFGRMPKPKRRVARTMMGMPAPTPGPAFGEGKPKPSSGQLSSGQLSSGQPSSGQPSTIEAPQARERPRKDQTQELSFSELLLVPGAFTNDKAPSDKTPADKSSSTQETLGDSSPSDEADTSEVAASETAVLDAAADSNRPLYSEPPEALASEGTQSESAPEPDSAPVLPPFVGIASEPAPPMSEPPSVLESTGGEAGAYSALLGSLEPQSAPGPDLQPPFLQSAGSGLSEPDQVIDSAGLGSLSTGLRLSDSEGDVAGADGAGVGSTEAQSGSIEGESSASGEPDAATGQYQAVHVAPKTLPVLGQRPLPTRPLAAVLGIFALIVLIGGGSLYFSSEHAGPEPTPESSLAMRSGLASGPLSGQATGIDEPGSTPADRRQPAPGVQPVDETLPEGDIAEAVDPAALDPAAVDPTGLDPAAVDPDSIELADSNTLGSDDLRGSSRARTESRSPENRMQRFQRLRQQALSDFRARRFPQAARSYLAATQLNPRHAGSFAGLGASRLAMGETRQALSAYRQAVQINPRHAGFQAALGRTYQAAGNGPQARQSYQRALAIDPNNGAARRGLSQL